MRIGLDARYLAASPAGIGRYSRALMEAMFRLAPQVEWVVLVHESLPAGWPPAPPPRFELHRHPSRPVSRFTVGALGRWIRAQRLDLWHAMFPLAPRCPVPMVTTVHDLQPLQCQGWNGKRPWPLPWAYERFYRWGYGRTVRQARRVIAISRWTASSVAEFWPGAAPKTTVIPYGLETTWAERCREEEAPTPASPSIVYAGSTRPNKNLRNLIDAFSLLTRCEEIADTLRLRLVVVRDRFWPDIERRIHTLGLAERVDVCAPLGDEALTREYRRASALAFATTHEGFGLPPLEAMACGCPVVAARHGALPETCGDAAEYVDPADPEDIARGLAVALTKGPRREALIAAGYRRAALRRWDEAARETLAVYGVVLGAEDLGSAPHAARSEERGDAFGTLRD
ncbi:MAG: glycosyltransferase family 4 protein [Candidatus Sumerlaeia bacterium]|nr:glycosyltransferase family 4 protein [Candidatus Sumerlaeia bacterium]